MERVWLLERLAISVASIDFIDPEVAGEADARERGLRVEVRPVTAAREGSIYASASMTLHPAVCRIDLLESAPGRADRMHWHPAMHDGEPGPRVFDRDVPADPVGWLTRFLRSDLRDFLVRTGLPQDAVLAGDLETVRGAADAIGAAVREGLARAREPWPDVEHDERGLAAVP